MVLLAAWGPQSGCGASPTSQPRGQGWGTRPRGSRRLCLRRQAEFQRAAFSFFRAGNLISVTGWLLRPSPVDRRMDGRTDG